jgi:hypothetical protein
MSSVPYAVYSLTDIIIWDTQTTIANFTLNERIGRDKWLAHQLYQMFQDSKKFRDSILIDEPTQLIQLREKLLAYYPSSRLEPIFQNLKEARAYRSLMEIQEETSKRAMLTHFYQLKREQIAREEIAKKIRERTFGKNQTLLTDYQVIETYRRHELNQQAKTDLILSEEIIRVRKLYRRSLVAILDARPSYELANWQLQQIQQQIIKNLPFDPTQLD